jgi:hypothetical protein
LLRSSNEECLISLHEQISIREDTVLYTPSAMIWLPVEFHDISNNSDIPVYLLAGSVMKVSIGIRHRINLLLTAIQINGGHVWIEFTEICLVLFMEM